MEYEEKKQLIERYVEAYNAFDLGGMLSALHPDVVFRNFSGGTETANASGLEPFRRLAEQSAGLFASRCQTLGTLIVHGG
jgi:hypothetical protein